ncbi:MAG: metalloendopeptidase glycoprotease family [Desulfomicrobiaceae bacterium]|jgi:N6-L-threonylcarbamoyladenine synthase|nr:tRNA (adenosine(37)-N6)-threonylcarbamoyltransferase complex transferase subunit TsaD [Desulfomicrobiaceae bacterium]MBZ4647786.1 metalloendopeptidase glycoprotease family [Desulfomicrobiaceae bacterium]MBZ4684963.1 metalloendopeptidase glycoprotease family [Desulfomicrobiaceae bacterium]MDI3492536.1 tRNA N6-adenosine threonylcarbamoyltransferase [Desulfomicrobiaceae bacterium]MDK2872579.1 tRNA N6-adenosine threonylcarbamoyltransferase [Desulfomicrobiaceae bacterium]
MRVLGIETSCDESAAAVWDDGVRACRTQSQIPMHAVFGGVVPELASREHLRVLPSLVEQTLADAGLEAADVDLIAVTRGPGLLGALLVGVAFAKAMAVAVDRPILGIDHLQAHLMAAFMDQEPVFPALGLLVSGGHTALYAMHDVDRMELLGRTLDDAAGEAFDKIAKLLNLPYPGGVYLDALAQRGSAARPFLPRPFLDNDHCDFSFSGLKTAAGMWIREHAIAPLEYRNFDVEAVPAVVCDLCAEVNQAVVDTLMAKTRRALARFSEARALVVAGGVAANTGLRAACATLAQEHGLAFFVPPLTYCGDNGAMVAFLGHLLGTRGYRHDLSFEAIARGRRMPHDVIRTSS